MINLLKPSDMDNFLSKVFDDKKKGRGDEWCPHVAIVASITVDDKPQVLLVKTSQEKLKDGAKPSWMLPQRRINEGESIADAALRVLTDETGIKDVTFIRSLGYFKRKLPNGRAKPAGWEEAEGLLMVYVYVQINELANPLCPCDTSIAECRLVDKGQYVELIATASNGKHKMSDAALKESGVFAHA